MSGSKDARSNALGESGKLLGRMIDIPLPDHFDIVPKRSPFGEHVVIVKIGESVAAPVIKRPVEGYGVTKGREQELRTTDLSHIVEIIAPLHGVTTGVEIVGGHVRPRAAGKPKRGKRSVATRGAAHLPPADRWAGLVAPPLLTAEQRAEAADRLVRLRLQRRAARFMSRGGEPAALARALEVDGAEAKRLIARRDELQVEEQPEEIVLRRAVDEIDDEEMLLLLARRTYTAGKPSFRGRLDASVTTGGTAKQLTRARRDGLLSEQEYRALLERVRVEPLPS